MRRLAFFAAIAIASLWAAAPASADVARYQEETATLTVALQGAHQGKLHTFTVTRSQCDGSFTGTGSGNAAAGGAMETITGSFADGNLSFEAVYSTFIPGYTWMYDGPLTGGTAHDSLGGHFDVTATFTVTATSDWKNHGQYVKAKGGGADAAHSCIGKPMPFTWSHSGTLDASSAAGASVPLPVAGQYQIAVSGTWQNGPWWLVDAEWVQQKDGGGNVGTTLVWDQGWPGYAPNDFGDVMVNGAFVDWGAFNAAHAYTYSGAFSGPLTLAVYDSYHGDNVGSLPYTVTYVGP